MKRYVNKKMKIDWMLNIIKIVTVTVLLLLFAQIFVVYFTEPDMFYETEEYNKRKVQVGMTKLSIFNVAEKLYYR